MGPRLAPLAQAVGLLALPFVLLGFYATDDGLMYHLLERTAVFAGMAVVGNLTAPKLAVGTSSPLFWSPRGRWWTGGRAVARRVHFEA